MSEGAKTLVKMLNEDLTDPRMSARTIQFMAGMVCAMIGRIETLEREVAVLKSKPSLKVPYE